MGLRTSEKVQKNRGFGSVALARAVRIERVSEKDADAEEDKQCSRDLGHRLAPSIAMPGRAALRNWRQIALRTRASIIEPHCLIKADGISRLLRDDFAVGENGFIGPVLTSYGLALIDRHHMTACKPTSHQRPS
jgi:hypothetical protein